jgi:hypothetical protein
LYSAVNKKSNSKDKIDQIVVDGVVFTDPKIMADNFNIFLQMLPQLLPNPLFPLIAPLMFLYNQSTMNPYLVFLVILSLYRRYRMR